MGQFIENGLIKFSFYIGKRERIHSQNDWIRNERLFVTAFYGDEIFH